MLAKCESAVSSKAASEPLNTSYFILLPCMRYNAFYIHSEFICQGLQMLRAKTKVHIIAGLNICFQGIRCLCTINRFFQRLNSGTAICGDYFFRVAVETVSQYVWCGSFKAHLSRSTTSRKPFWGHILDLSEPFLCILFGK